MTANTEFFESDVLRAYEDFATWKIAVTVREAIDNRQDSRSVRAWMSEEIDNIAIRTVTGEGGILFSDLLKKRFPPEDFLVEGLVTTGLTVLTGASKIGKSWAALQLVTALDRGGYFLGTLKAQKCDVLYCALEDTPKRVQKRLQKQGVGVFNGSRLETKR
jgi:predicted ATP-dependent serine protease